MTPDLLEYVKFAEGSTNQKFPLRVSMMTADHANFWDEHVQPTIDTYHTARADQSWEWPVIRRYVTLLGSALRQEPVALSLDIERSGGALMPCALFVGVQNYPFPREPRVNSCFVWFMTAAPAEVLPSLL